MIRVMSEDEIDKEIQSKLEDMADFDLILLIGYLRKRFGDRVSIDIAILEY